MLLTSYCDEVVFVGDDIVFVVDVMCVVCNNNCCDG